MSFGLDTLFARLPAEIRRADHMQGLRTLAERGQWNALEDPAEYGPLRSLLSVMLREGQLIERDIAQLYDDHFIETCADWAVPYIGELIGALRLEPVPGADAHRRLVAATLALGRAKGTLAALEYAVSAATARPVAAVEYWRRTATTVSLRRPRFRPRFTAGLRDPAALERMGTGFETGTRLFEARRPDPMAAHAHGRRGGLWNLRTIGLHTTARRTIAIGATGREATAPTGSPAATLDPGHIVVPGTAGPLCYRFSPLGCDAPLFVRPERQALTLGEMRGALDMPGPLGRHTLDRLLDPAVNAEIDRVVGPRGLFNIAVRKGATVTDIDPLSVRAANLSERVPGSGPETWHVAPVSGTTFVDPETGRFVLDADHAGADAVYVSWHSGRTHDIGGRPREESEIVPTDGAATFDMTGETDFEAVPPLSTGDDPIDIFFRRSTAYVFDGARTVSVASSGERTLNIVATQGAWPTVHIRKSAGLRLDCADGVAVNISGIHFVADEGLSRMLSVTGDDVKLLIEDCTLVPGRSLHPSGAPNEPEAATLRIGAGASARIVRSVLGPIEAGEDVDLVLEDCVVDAGSLARLAISAGAGSRLSLIRTTVIGRVEAGAVGGPDHYDEVLSGDFPMRSDPGESDGGPRGIRDSLILAVSDDAPAVSISDIQRGCVSHSFVPPGSRVPRRFACIPGPGEDPVHWPVFRSLRYGSPDYARLARGNREALLRGASDGSEMGVGARLAEPARARNLATASGHYLRFGFSADASFDRVLPGLPGRRAGDTASATVSTAASVLVHHSTVHDI